MAKQYLDSIIIKDLIDTARVDGASEISIFHQIMLPIMVQSLRSETYRTEYGAIYLGLAVSIVPIIILYTFFSRYIISGITMGSVKE